MDQERLFVEFLLFKRVMKCLKDHQCAACGEVIERGSSCYCSLDTDPVTFHFIRYCLRCFEERLGIHTPLTTEIGLDR
jgi:hypothetical protein